MILVTGANGMLGRAVVRQLRDQGQQIRGFDLQTNPDKTVESVVGDIRNRQEIQRACIGVTGVIHTASLVDLHLGEPSRLYDINVRGTENLIAACRANEITRLVYMSSAEVISGATPLRHVTESVSYPNPHLTYYGVTKESAERRVLNANDAQLATCAFRTYGLFGEGDRNFLGFAIKKARGKQIPIIGDGKALTNVVYAGNIAHALILGLNQLEIGNPISGQVFHITDHAPENVQHFVVSLLTSLGFNQAKYGLPLRMAKSIARVSEWLYRLTRAERFAHPPLTTHQLLLATQDYYLDDSKARNLLSYTPKFTRQEAVARTQAWLINKSGQSSE